MSTRGNGWKRRGASLGLLAGVAAAPIGAGAGAPEELVFARFAPATLAGEQTIRINVASFHGSDFNAAKTGNGDEGLVCKTLVQLYDEVGNVLLSDVLQVGAREGAQVTASAGELGIGPAERSLVHAGVGTPQSWCAQQMTGSLEIVDTTTGKVEIVVPPSRALAD